MSSPCWFSEREGELLEEPPSPLGAHGDAGSVVGHSDDMFLLNAPPSKPSRLAIPDNALVLCPSLCSSSKNRNEDPEQR